MYNPNCCYSAQRDEVLVHGVKICIYVLFSLMKISCVMRESDCSPILKLVIVFRYLYKKGRHCSRRIVRKSTQDSLNTAL